MSKQFPEAMRKAALAKIHVAKSSLAWTMKSTAIYWRPRQGSDRPRI